MSVITISRGSYSHGKKIAERVSEKLGYECVSRETILNASHRFITPQTELLRVADDASSAPDRFAYGKEKYLAYVRKAILECLRKDNVVYHGFEGHFFAQGVSHVLKIRIIADMDDRAAEEMSRKGITAAQARNNLKKDDEAHQRWSHFIYGRDNADPSLYNLVIPVHDMSVDDTAEIICRAAKRPGFQPTPASLNAMRMLYLAAQVQASLMEEAPFAKVEIEEKDIVVATKGYWADGKKMIAKVGQIIDSEKEAVGIKVRLTSR